MKKAIIKKSLFICLLVLSATCFSYLSLYGAASAYTVDSLASSAEIQSSALSDVNGMKNVLLKILKMMMLKF